VPHDGEDYVHRIGRTARAAAEGTAYTFISPKEQRKFLSIERLLGKPVTKATVPPEFGEVPEYNNTSSIANRRSGGGAKKKFFNPNRHNNSNRGN
jgi:superfamily II DNA/RNA helicase